VSTAHEIDLHRWMTAYGRAYRGRDPDAGAALFADRATYQWGPFGPLLRGRDAIREEWARGVERMEPGDIGFRHEVLIAGPDLGVARWLASYPVNGDSAREEIDGIFAVRLGADGLCVEFREWWNSREVPVED
jgi:ketosteroid isomerase-like protein